jgi:hypothetical protein
MCYLIIYCVCLVNKKQLYHITSTQTALKPNNANKEAFCTKFSSNISFHVRLIRLQG